MSQMPSKQDPIRPRFFIKAVQMKAESEKAGRPIFVDREFVEQIIPGDSRTLKVDEVKDEHRMRWPAQYEAFKRGQEQPLHGTPLEQWPALSASQVAELKALKVMSVEDLANLNESFLANIGMGARELQTKAKAFLAHAAGTADVQRMQAELSRRDDEIADLKRQIAELANRFDEKRGPGRPRKEAA